MNALKLEYENRLKEFDELLDFLKIIEGTHLYNSSSEKVIYSNSVVNSIKSSLILIIYNLIEYTVLTSISLIEDDFKNYDFDNFIDDFKSIFLKTFGRYLDNSTYSTINYNIKNNGLANSINESTIKYGYYSSGIDLNSKCKMKVSNNKKSPAGISGNISYNTIEVLASFFDFTKNYTKDINSRVDLLAVIRDKRNNLSHGNVSFNFLGKSISSSILNDYRNSIDKFFIGYIASIEKYITDKPYLNKQFK